MNRYVALLRGINVGGNNLIKMADLAACFESMGFANVRTYIQSGNVIFDADGTDQALLVTLLEEALSKRFNYASNLVLRSDKEMREIITNRPGDFGSEPETYRYDVLFLKEPLTTAEALKSIIPKEGVDQAFAGNRVLYFSRLISKASRSHLTRIVGSPVYRSLTIRNWNTTTKLLELMEAMNP